MNPMPMRPVEFYRDVLRDDGTETVRNGIGGLAILVGSVYGVAALLCIVAEVIRTGPTVRLSDGGVRLVILGIQTAAGVVMALGGITARDRSDAARGTLLTGAMIMLIARPAAFVVAIVAIFQPLPQRLAAGSVRLSWTYWCTSAVNVVVHVLPALAIFLIARRRETVDAYDVQAGIPPPLPSFLRPTQPHRARPSGEPEPLDYSIPPTAPDGSRAVRHASTVLLNLLATLATLIAIQSLFQWLPVLGQITTYGRTPLQNGGYLLLPINAAAVILLLIALPLFHLRRPATTTLVIGCVLVATARGYDLANTLARYSNTIMEPAMRNSLIVWNVASAILGMLLPIAALAWFGRGTVRAQLEERG